MIKDNPYNVNLSQEERQRVQDLVDQGNGCLRSSAESVIEFGKVLIQLKEVLQDGDFTECVKREYDLELKTAENMMNVARRFGHHPKFISGLKPTVLYLLASPSCPYEAVDKVFEMVQNDERVTVAAVKELIKDSKAPRKKPDYVDPMEEPDYVHQKDIDDLEKQLRAKMSFLISEAERVKKDLDKLYKSVRDKNEFAEKATVVFNVRKVPEHAKKVLHALLDPENLVRALKLKIPNALESQ